MKGFIIALIMLCNFQTANAKNIVLTTKNHCSLQEGVDFISMQKLKFCLVDKAVIRRGRDYPIYLVINSRGGKVSSGLSFISFAKTFKNIQTVSIYAASMASAIVQALPGKRYGTEHVILMFHRATATFKGQFENGEVESRLRLWKSIMKKIDKVNANRIGITVLELKRRARNEWHIYSNDNIKYNTLDEIVILKCSQRLLLNKKKIKIKSLFGNSSTHIISACPLVNR